MIKIYLEKCIGCGKCVTVCPFGAIEMKNKKAIVNEKCTLCGACIEVCPVNAIEKPELKLPKKDFSQYKGVGFFIEQKNGVVQPISYELINIGRKLADTLGEPLIGFLFGNNMKDELQKLRYFDVDKIVYIEHPELEKFNTDLYADVLSACLLKYKLNSFIAGATTIGRAFLPKVAAKLGTGLTADCTGLEIRMPEKMLIQTRPAFGGNIMAVIETPNHRPQMATVRHKVFPASKKLDVPKAEIIEESFPIEKINLKQKVLEVIEELEGIVKLEEADIIVTGGRGIGKPENFEYIEELAKLLGGAVGATRAVVDAGWISYSHQVGQTGKTVCPKLYMAIGVSGAIQHLAGMKTSKMIIAVNKDPDAPIFKVAHYGVVCDAMTFVKEMIAKLKARSGQY